MKRFLEFIGILCRVNLPLSAISSSIFLGGLTVYATGYLYPLWMSQVILSFLSVLAYRLRSKVVWLIICFFFGYYWFSMVAQSRQVDQFLEEELKAPIWVTGKILALTKNTSHSKQFLLKTAVVAGKPIERKIKLTWRQMPNSIRPGQSWRMHVVLQQPRATLNPGCYDVEKTYFVHNIKAIGRVREAFLIAPPTDFLSRWRHTIQTALPKTSMRPLLLALVLGDTSELTSMHWQVLKKTGTAHLMAISGLHIGLSAALGMLLVGSIWRLLPLRCLQIPAQIAAAYGGILSSIAYAGLAGASLPTIRAVIMIICLLGSRLLGRTYAIWQGYFLALALVFLVQPLALMTAGFWLSFGSVGFILFCVTGRIKPLRGWWHTLGLQIKLTIGLIPLSLLFFQEVSLVSIAANACAIPVISFGVVPPLLIGLICLAGFPTLTAGCFSGAAYVLSTLWSVLHWFSETNLVWAPLGLTFYTIFLALLGTVYVTLPRGLPGRWLGAILMIPLLWPTSLKIPLGQARLTMLDVGQGLAVVIQTRHHRLVFDTGASWGTSDSGQQVLVPFLRQAGIKELDMLIISHPDRDHIGGAQSLVASIPPQKVLISDPAYWSGASACRRGQMWIWDDVIFRILSPTSLAHKKRNEHSCVLQVLTTTYTALLPGDIGQQTERQLVADFGEDLESDILIAPHHGSKSSSSPNFLEAILPSHILVSVGYRNPYGHPHPQSVQRYQDLMSVFWSSITCGAVTILPTGQPWCERQERKRYWRF